MVQMTAPYEAKGVVPAHRSRFFSLHAFGERPYRPPLLESLTFRSELCQAQLGCLHISTLASYHRSKRRQILPLPSWTR